MSIINITVKEKIAQNPTKEIVCGNSGYVVYFNFDEEWESHPVKTARFSFNGTFIDVVFEGNTVNVPIITNANTCAVGVYAGDLQTTTPAIVKCQKSILCEGGFPADPLPDVYNQIVELCTDVKEIAESVEERADNGEFKGDKGDPFEYEDFTAEQLASLKGDKGDSYILTDADKEEIANEIAESIKDVQTKDGTIVSQNADFAEVAEWADGNPNNEDRTGYFVCANVPVDGIVMKKATSIDDVKGVTILAPAFAGNYSNDKLDSNGNLLPKYSYVAIIGFVPVRDNGTCTVGGRCMPDDNGCAIPSSNSMGYQVVNRIDKNRVLIIIEPNGDMVQRIKTRVNELQEDINEIDKVYVGSGEMPEGYNIQIDPNGDEYFEVEQTFNPESTNPQSGIAVAEAVSGKADKPKNYELIETITLTEDISMLTRNTEPNENTYAFKEVLIKFIWKNGTEKGKWIKLNITAGGITRSGFRAYSYAESGNTNTISWIMVPYFYGKRIFILSDATDNLGYTGYSTQIPAELVSTTAPIDAISLQHQTVFKAGTTIEIWGVRA